MAGEVAAPEGAGPPTASTGQLRGMVVACAAAEPADVVVWRPAEAPTAVAHLRQVNVDPKHGMCMALAFLPPAAAHTEAHSPAAPCASERPSSSADSAGAGTSRGEGRGPGGTGVCGGGSADPRFIVTGYEDGVVALWDLRRTGSPLASLRVHEEPIMCLDVHPRSGSGKGGAAGKRSVAVGPTCHDGDGSGGASSRGACDGDGVPAGAGDAQTYDLVSGSADDHISCCAVRPAQPPPLALAKQVALREAGTADVRVRPDGKLFAAGCWDGRARLYSLRKRELLAVLKYHRDQITALAFSPLTGTLATASRDTTVALWSVYPTPARRADP